MAGFRGWAQRQFDDAMAMNLENIERGLGAVAPGGTMLDLGCADGERTLDFARAARAAVTHGVEITPEHVDAARGRGILVTVADLNGRLPLDDRSFDAIVANQVIEHLADTDAFVSETHRLLRPGGVAVVSTENLASWHNVAALVLGWQPFSLTNVSDRRLGVGNPMAIHRGEEPQLKSWEHLRVFAHRGLRELFEAHGMTVEDVLGAGYYPLPAGVGRREPRHAAFLTVVARRG